MAQLFCYGTLMYQPLLEALAGRPLSIEAARLPGFRCLEVLRADYPGIVACDGFSVEGILVRDIPSPAWPRLDRYEGEMYRRSVVRPVRDDGVTEKAWAYVIRPCYSARLGKKDWHFGPNAQRYAKMQLAALIDRKPQE